MWAFGAITNNPEYQKTFKNMFLTKVEGIPKDGEPLD